jgi:phosphate starvation-inducible protein PhoH and related proteins
MASIARLTRAVNSMTFTENQRRYMQLLESPEYAVIICTGPAGSGKTLVPCKYALKHSRRYEKIVISRPAVDAGESLGFLPGSMEKKVEPYMRPILDHVGNSKNLEICPIAYMRGRTFDDSIVLLDEAQNCTIEQTKLALTRIGMNSKMVICGDEEQCDLDKESGLSHLIRLYKSAPRMPASIRLIELTAKDIKRSDAAREVLELYGA